MFSYFCLLSLAFLLVRFGDTVMYNDGALISGNRQATLGTPIEVPTLPPPN